MLWRMGKRALVLGHLNHAVMYDSCVQIQAATEVRESMVALGVHLRQDWIAHCLGQGTTAGGAQSAKEEIYRIFLACDLREAGEACLPTGVGDMVKERLKGKVVVQVGFELVTIQFLRIF